VVHVWEVEVTTGSTPTPMPTVTAVATPATSQFLPLIRQSPKS
jgi:hypothetical protein